MDGFQDKINHPAETASDTRLIERWLPIAALGIESLRERTPMTPFPAPNRLHVWWARRPLVASRAALLASMLPAGADRAKFMHATGIHGDPVAAKERIAIADRLSERLGKNAYGYPRAFGWTLDDTDISWLSENGVQPSVVVLDPTAGGGSIPFEAIRLGVTTISNDLNPVASLIEKATIEYPAAHGAGLAASFAQLGREFTSRVRARLQGVFPEEPEPGARPDGYLWARTIRCPYCEGLVPLSPNWRLASDGTGVRLNPFLGAGKGDAVRCCTFEIVASVGEHSAGTVSDGDATCPFPDCGRVIDGDEVKRQAQAGDMGEQLFAVVVKRRVATRTKADKPGHDKWKRGYRAPSPKDDNRAEIKVSLTNRMQEWDTLDVVPKELIDSLSNYDRGHRMYGTSYWKDFCSPRQLLVMGESVAVFRELWDDANSTANITGLQKAVFVYLAIAIDTMLNYGTRSCRWDGVTERVRSVFDRHGFAMLWSYGEMAALVPGLGLDWCLEKTGDCIDELVALTRPDLRNANTLLPSTTPFTPPSITITCKPGDALDHIADATVDVIVMDPPYYDNVMYAELSDFFYVWLKRTVGQVMPELFTRRLTDKENEAVANPAKFAGQKGAKALAGRDYQERMARIFAECRRVLKANGIMTLMFTHKATGAWDALTKGLMEAGFIITASWPINTEAEGSLHIKDKSAANSTIFLVCRPRLAPAADDAVRYWEDVEPLVARAVRRRVEEFQAAGIGGVDLYLACFGPALEEFSRNWPLKRGTPRPVPEERRRRRQTALFEEEYDPYAVTPEDALDAARREVKSWRLDQLGQKRGHAELDPLTSFFVLAWDSFRAPVFPYDEALRLARAVGVDLDGQVVGVLADKKGSDLVLWDSGRRAAKGALGAPDGSRAMLDALHHAAHLARSRTLAAAKEALERAQLLDSPIFHQALTLVLEVLPVGRSFSGAMLDGDLASAASDFEALENLRRLALAEAVPAPKQLELWVAPG